MSKKTKKRKLKIKNILIIILVVFLLSAFGTYVYYHNSLKAMNKQHADITFTIEEGQSFKKVLANLEAEGLIKDKNTALIYAKFHDLTNIKMGTYVLNDQADVHKILTTLNSTTTALSNGVRLTFVEGDWAKHIALKISEGTNVSQDELLALWNDENYIRSLMDSYPFLTEDIFNQDARILLEGYLCPNTYEFDKETNADAITRKILDQTLVVYEKFKDQMATSSLSIHEIYTLASVVQYEASKVEDMKMIAQVFYNRLAQNMPLQSSVTVCYALDIEKDDDWFKCEANPNYDSPYNTYMYQGLPPGPILNPGEEAIAAVLNPQPNDYIYFMADVYGDGTVYYAKTYEEHQANVAKYLK
ncbi:MAG: endolytic transglycosylase MltG [Erysipelotrichaceae bacterium]|nr:endolytic transglycosylase MltG [Erysipelotrichaceae bacterium]MDY5251843.1 endolytic transglycosylase MltG [Erysipelotrichaceae bacterium]